ncbi:MAG: hypothetical protein AB1512_07625 [Thermodesulfobacteriota bacterium]
MEKHNPPIEGLPFFEGFQEAGKAIVDVKRFEKWLEEAQGVELMSPEDEVDRANAYDELKSGKALDLREAMKEW